ncbi:MAG: phospholipid carrier-dependent glycosyltransferase [Candidatus Limnocylindria bacterium]
MTLAATLVRVPALNRPIGFVFDEIFYARDACVYAGGPCGIAELTSRAHPPLGKWMIAAGIKVFGYSPFGWRITAALAGIATVVLLYLLARRLLSGTVPGPAATLGSFAAAGLLATDFLHVVQSRVAMLDVFTTLFVVAAVLAIVHDRDRGRDGVQRAGPLRRFALGRPWRLLAGICLGAATATKWNGAYVATAVVGLTVAWELAARMRAPHPTRRGVLLRALREEGLPTVILLGAVPVIVYIAAYTGRMPGAVIGLPWQEGTFWRGIWDHQVAMLQFHTTLGGNHPYESAPWSWLLLKRPIAYYFSDQNGQYREILALGNPIVWWTAGVGLVALAVRWARAGWSLLAPEAVVIAAVLGTYAPWLILSGSRSQVFLWYLLPTVPFLCAGLGIVIARAWRSMVGRVATGAFAVAVLASFLVYLPLLTALPLSPAEWRLRMLFTDCGRPGAATMTLPDDTVNQGPPPRGWCWI